jgi:hypothetical protein
MWTYVIGLTEKDANRFEATKETLLTIAAQKSLAADLQVSQIKDAGVWPAYRLNKHPLIVNSISRSDFHDGSYEQLVDKVGEEPYKFIVLNEKTLDVINAHGIDLPPVLGKLESAELPENLNTELNTRYVELVRV